MASSYKRYENLTQTKPFHVLHIPTINPNLLVTPKCIISSGQPKGKSCFSSNQMEHLQLNKVLFSHLFGQKATKSKSKHAPSFKTQGYLHIYLLYMQFFHLYSQIRWPVIFFLFPLFQFSFILIFPLLQQFWITV